jgi:FdhD protein
MDAVAERVCRLVVNGRTVAVWTASPGGERELAVGRLVSDGFVREPADVIGVNVTVEDSGVVVLAAELSADAAERGFAERAHRSACGLGLLHFLVCDASVLRARRESSPPAPDALAGLMRELFAGSPSRGTHSAALVDAGGLLVRVEEVGRHNAVDRTIGEAFLRGLAPGRLGLVVSSRISGEIALKAARAGLAWVASRSIPTTLAVRLAEAGGLPLVARAGAVRQEDA